MKAGMALNSLMFVFLEIVIFILMTGAMHWTFGFAFQPALQKSLYVTIFRFISLQAPVQLVLAASVGMCFRSVGLWWGASLVCASLLSIVVAHFIYSKTTHGLIEMFVGEGRLGYGTLILFSSIASALLIARLMGK